LSRARGPLTASIIHTSFVALVLLSACGRTEVEEEFLTRTVEDGVTVVTNLPGTPIGSPVFTFEPILTLNEDPANEESLLARASYQPRQGFLSIRSWRQRLVLRPRSAPV